MKKLFVIPEILSRESTKRYLLILIWSWVPAFAGMTNVWADGTGTTTGLSLLRNSGARSSAMGEAFSAMTDDVTAMEFNPSALASLERGHFSMHHERGVFEDTFSKAVLGFKQGDAGAFGVSLGYFNSGKALLYDGVNPERSVVAQRDILGALGYGFRHNAYNFGAIVKYLDSELAETNSDSAVSAEIGAQYQLRPNWRIGASGPVVQTKMKYGTKEEDIASVYRAGIGWNSKLPLATGALPFRIMFDVPYYANESEVAYAVGAEFNVGIMALRLGSNTRSDIQQFTMGAGFQFQNFNFDYSFGLVNNGNFDAVHKINFAVRFDQAPERALRQSVSGQKKSGEKLYGVYEVKPGETLETIAKERYGSASAWAELFSWNRHLYDSPDQIKPGSKIIVPIRPE